MSDLASIIDADVRRSLTKDYAEQIQTATALRFQPRYYGISYDQLIRTIHAIGPSFREDLDPGLASYFLDMHSGTMKLHGELYYICMHWVSQSSPFTTVFLEKARNV